MHKVKMYGNPSWIWQKISRKVTKIETILLNNIDNDK